MFVDIAIPEGNEKELLDMAKKLGYNDLVFLYDKKIKNNYKKIFLAKNSNESTKEKSNFDFIAAKENFSFNDKRVDIVFDLENSSKKDFMHHRASGLNHVVARQLKENKTSIAFNFNNLLGNNKDIIIGRMMQNIVLCRKYKIKIIMASFAKKPYEMRAPKDLISFGVSIGMHPSEAKKSIQWIY